MRAGETDSCFVRRVYTTNYQPIRCCPLVSTDARIFSAADGRAIFGTPMFPEIQPFELANRYGRFVWKIDDGENRIFR